MLAEGLWTRERKRKAHRQRRLRKAHFGELVQMDGSFEDVSFRQGWVDEKRRPISSSYRVLEGG